jgi:hypothetical protein
MSQEIITPVAGETVPTDHSDSEHAHNELVMVEALCLIAWDGDPATEGQEYYAPKNWDEAGHKKANGIEGDLVDADGAIIVIRGSQFECTRLMAERLIKSRQVRMSREWCERLIG